MPGRLANLISGEDFISFMNAGYKNQGSNIPFSDIPSTYTTDTNWEKEILENSSLLQDYSITFDGSSNKTNYMLSTGFYNQEGLLKAQNYQKYTFHGNLQHSFNKWLTVGANTQFTYSIQDVFDSALIDIYRYGWPTENVKNEDDTYNISSMHNTYILYPWNPVLDMNETTTQFTTNRFLGTLFAEMQLMKDLKYRLNLGVDLKNTRKYNYVGSESAVNKASGLKGNGYNNWNKGFSKVMENILTYNHTWNKHRLTATAVYSWQDFTYEDINLSGSGFENDLTGAWSMGLADKSSISWGTNKYSNKLISFTGRVSYVYDDKYLLTATSRWDGSSRFGANNKWGYFPSVGLGWRLSQESFLKENKVITNLKIRGSFGITGNQEIGNYKSLAQLTGSNYTDGSSVIYGFKESIGNGDLKWERTTQFDLGFDLSLWNRMDIAFDYYTRNTNDLLYNVPIPSTSGYSSILSNIGKVTNKGWELSVGGNIMQNKDFNLYASVNVTYNQNKIKELYGGVDEVAVRYEAGGLARVLKVGNSVDAIYARHSLGIIKTQEQLDEYKKKVPNTAANAQLGDEMYEDIDGDGSISSNDYVCLGSVQPKYFYGLNLSMEYKGFGLSVYGQGGHKYASIAGAEDYYANELHRVQHELEEIAGHPITDAQLFNSIQLYNKQKELMRRFPEVACDHLDIFTPKVRHYVYKAARVMPVELHTRLVAELLDELDDVPVYDFDGPRLIATSILMDSTELLDTLEQEGIAIVGDDIVGDSKRFETDAPAHVDPFVSLARIWPHIEGCSVLYDPKKLRGPMLIDLYNQRKADGILISIIKFCEEEEFDYPVLKKDFEAEGIPVLYLETENQGRIDEQAATRIQAFVEMLD